MSNANTTPEKLNENDAVFDSEPETQAPADNEPPKPSKDEKQKKKKNRGGKRKKKIKKILFWLIVLVAIAAFAGYKLGFFGGNSGMQNAETYNTFSVARRDIQNVLTGTGTLEPADSYTVTALASGEITEDYFEEGDVVSKDQLLMKIDSENLVSSLERAQNSYDNAQKTLNDLYDDRADLIVRSDYSGILQVMDLEVGDEVMKGAVVASVIDRDTMLIDVPFMQADTFNIYKGSAAVLTISDTLEEISGTVDKISPSYKVNENGVKTVDVTIAVKNPGVITENTSATAKIGDYTCTGSAKFYYNINKQITSDGSGKVATIVKDEGDYVNAGDVIVTLSSDSLEDNIETAERNLKDAANSLKDAGDAFDNYEITAPIAGTVVEKNYKKGEKIGSSGNGNTIAKIFDLSCLKFEMNIDELDIDSLALGQEVQVTSDAKTGHTYVGKITKISIQGTTSNGTTYYPITVTLDDYGSDTDGSALRPGMNIDAEIILEKAENVLAVPVDAVSRGNKVKVIKNPEAYATGSDNNKDSKNSGDVPSLPDGAPANTPSPDGFTPDTDAASGETAPVGEQTGLTPPTAMNGGYSTVPKTAEYTEVTVETGISDDDYIEILSGLEEGDVVIVESAERSGSDWTQMMMGGGMGGGNMGGGNMGGGPGGGGPSGGGPGGPGM